MNIGEEKPTQQIQRKRATTHLSDSGPVLNTREFFEQNFPDVLDKGRVSAAKMATMLQGRQVRRTYFFPENEVGEQAKRPPIVFEVARVTSEEAGIVRLYDVKGDIREFPTLVFNFVYRPDNQAVICIGMDYTVLLEVVG